MDQNTPDDCPPLTCKICGLPYETPPDDAHALVCPGCEVEPPASAAPTYTHKARTLTAPERRAMSLPPYVGVTCPAHNLVHVPVDLFLRAREAFGEWKLYLHRITQAEILLLAAETALEAIQGARPSDHAAQEHAHKEVKAARGQLRLLQDLAKTVRHEAQSLNAQVTMGMFIAAGRGEDDGSGVPPAEC